MGIAAEFRIRFFMQILFRAIARHLFMTFFLYSFFSYSKFFNTENYKKTELIYFISVCCMVLIYFNILYSPF